MAKTSIEKNAGAPERKEQAVIAVAQPQKLENLLGTIALLDTISERIGEGRSGDLGGGTGSTHGAQSQQSQREQAIAALPDVPMMQKQLEQHVRTEIKSLRKKAHGAAKRVSKPGKAHELNVLYARIRRLNSVLKQLFSASVEIIRRLYIRIFIDKQAAL